MMMRLLSILRRDSAGTAAIELGIILPVLAMITLASADFVMGFGYKMNLQQYAQSGADYVVASGATLPTDTDIKDEIASLSGLSTSKITIAKWTECNAKKTLDILGLCPGSSDVRARYIQIDVADTYDPILDVSGIADFVQSSKLTGSVVVRLP
ncbi:TadE/TadG family type IV pilus assembly protein [Pontixanthobacter gangjinensis]|uniref:TadE-like domain-containing protein n=1 Tax=Pontixanthobacter gangjinensis TaxID=1028742 RepID=A0A6I4SIJ1_9SPHN|nr:TadE/TadG family type IV pilus assembly protein [Pontixanthobacter gangjinensis]MXO55415.1 hypothetical protein [Pontixanthobacter gangjinensis]